MNCARWSLSLLLMAVVVGCQPAGTVPPEPPVLTAATGREIRRAAVDAGARVVLVNFWATWCIPCREEFPDLLRLHRVDAGRGLRLVLVSGDTDPLTARRFLIEQGVTFPSFIKEKTESDQRFIEELEPVWSGLYPSTFVYDGQGQLRASFEGKTTYAVFAAAVQEVLADGQTATTEHQGDLPPL
ncbi:TlpA family protein disulfide reductase [bacterium]|nr:TlpA family protein disulfide reductase [bacterium]